MSALHVSELREWRAYLRACTDRQLQGVYDKEWGASRYEVAELVVCEGERRGITLNEQKPIDD